MNNDDPVVFRIGIFFYLFSAFTFAIFIASDFAKKADFDYFFIALAFFAVGWYFRRNKKTPPSADRFPRLKNYLTNQKKKREERFKKKQDKKK